MAQSPLIYTKGSTIKLKAVGTVASAEVEIDCVNDDFEIDWGTKASEQLKCHKDGVYYDRATNMAFKETTINIKGLPSDKADNMTKFIFDSFYETAGTDFDLTDANGSKEFKIEITFVDPNANVITLQGFTTNINTMVVIDKSLTLSFGFQPTTKPVRA